LLKGARPRGYWNQPRSHNAVAASVAQCRADWGVAIRPVAEALGLSYIPIADEAYDFAVHSTFVESDRGRTFLHALRDSSDAIARLGYTIASTA
jgi:putative molybdopterin biosynthesis protein